MSPEVGEVADAIRTVLPRQQEWLMMNAVPAPHRGAAPDGAPRSYADFLAVADGLICGPLVLFDAATVSGMQFYAETAPDAPVQLSEKEWFCAGTVNDEPWFIHRTDETVWTFPDTGVTWWMSDRFARRSAGLEEFFLAVICGPEYPSLTGAEEGDQWWELLEEIGRVQ
jgi:hypothetical protein